MDVDKGIARVHGVTLVCVQFDNASGQFARYTYSAGLFMNTNPMMATMATTATTIHITVSSERVARFSSC